MTPHSDTVHNLALRGPTRSAIRAVVPEIEDALATASRPIWAVGGRKVYIQKLDLGVLRKGANRHSIAKVLEQKFARLENSGFQDQSTSEVVSFSSQIEAWTQCLVHILKTAPQPWWVGAVLDRKNGNAAVQDVLQAIQHGAGPTQNFLSKLGQVLSALIQKETVSDLVRVIEQMQAMHPSVSFVEDINAYRQSQTYAPFSEPLIAAARVADLDIGAAVLPMLAAELPPHLTEGMRKIFTALRSQTDGGFTLSVWTVSIVLEGCIAPASRQGLIEKIARKSTQRMFLETSLNVHHAEPLDDLSDASFKAESRQVNADQTLEPHPENVELQPLAPHTNLSQPLSHLYGLMCHQSGLVQLLNLISKTGLPAHDLSAQSDLSLRVFYAFLRRCDLPPELMEGLPVAPDLGYVSVGRYCPQSSLLSGLGRIECRPIEGQASLLALCLRGLPFAVVTPDESDGLIAKLDICRHSTSVDLPFGQLSLVNGLMLFLQRLTFGSLGCGWRNMVRRRGFIHATDTHLDITMDIDDVCLNERHFGLDITPGWLWWLGRVVSLHFEPFEAKDTGRDHE